MEYERIHKVQTGMISPSKLRMKLMGSINQKKRNGGSNTNSSRTSPSRLEDSEFVNNSLLELQIHDFTDQASSLEVPSTKCESSITTVDSTQSDENSLQSKELVSKDNIDNSRFRMQLVSKGDTSNASSVHPVRTYEDDNLDYDSTSSFEFHKGERSLHHSVSRSFSRPMPSKWNDAEKWIMNRQNAQSNVSKKAANLQNQVNRQSTMNMVRIVPESNGSENRPSVKRVDFVQPLGPGKSGFGSSNGGLPISSQVNGGNGLMDLCIESKDLTEVDDSGLPCTKSVTEENTGIPAIRSVSMRDMGTEMTPIPSQEPSRSVTPVSSTTPIRSPTSSIPSTPRRGEPAPTPTENTISNATENRKLSDEEMKIKTRREIVALGVQLGKINIANAWASKDEKEKGVSGNENNLDELECIENAKRAAAWEEAEKAKHAARFKREEIRIQAWESQQTAKLEAEMRKIEAQIEQMRAQAQAKMVKKVAMARQKSEEKRGAAEAKKSRQAEKTAGQVEYIRQTGRIPSSSFLCCGWS